MSTENNEQKSRIRNAPDSRFVFGVIIIVVCAFLVFFSYVQSSNRYAKTQEDFANRISTLEKTIGEHAKEIERLDRRLHSEVMGVVTELKNLTKAINSRNEASQKAADEETKADGAGDQAKEAGTPAPAAPSAPAAP